jgi:hypothetical protein
MGGSPIFDDLYAKYGVRRPGQAPSPSPQGGGLNPNQATIAGGTGGGQTVWQRMADDQGGAPVRGPNGLWYVNGKLANPSMQKFLNGQTGGGGGGGGVAYGGLYGGAPAWAQPQIAAGQLVPLGGGYFFNRGINGIQKFSPKGEPEKISQEEYDRIKNEKMPSPTTGAPVSPSEVQRQSGVHSDAVVKHNYGVHGKNADLIATYQPRMDALDEAKMLLTSGQTVSLGFNEKLLPVAEFMARNDLLPKELQGKVHGTRLLQALLAKMKPSLREPGSGEISNRDLEEFGNALPKLGDSPEAALMIINFMQQSMRRSQAVHSARDAWMATHNGSLYEFDDKGKITRSFDDDMKARGLDGLHQRFKGESDKWKADDWTRFNGMSPGDVFKWNKDYFRVVDTLDDGSLQVANKDGKTFTIARPAPPQPTSPDEPDRVQQGFF